ncbi:SpaA isopeptide-forming pilin-related protein [Bifidobacterium magnum]|uniref:PA14 domain-containing protein n=1 Tax=Bifidobacterium magnum TaxID=1692 RepID=A0A087BB36_9BIFI|nr:SpaA isopeptide-forming pilin-related protein [Bifidobacterium magnum]KFI68236.1 hypothetical protein BMAGN_0186 [Bifidobacterium magnum]
MADHNRYVPKPLRSHLPKRRWKAAASAIAAIVASAMVLSVGVNAYADDMRVVTLVEDRLARSAETQSNDNGLFANDNDNDMEEAPVQGTHEKGIDINALEGWSRASERDVIIGKTVALFDELAMVAITSALTDEGTLSAVPVDALTMDDISWQWKVVAAQGDAKDPVLLQNAESGEYVATDTGGTLSLAEKKEEAAEFALSFTDADGAAESGGLAETFRLFNVKAGGRGLELTDNAKYGTAKDGNATALIVYAKDIDQQDRLAGVLASGEDGKASEPDMQANHGEFDDLVIDEHVVNPKNTVINLFDYWERPNRNDPTPGWGFQDQGPVNHPNGGINAGHAFKFVTNSGSNKPDNNNGLGLYNNFTESDGVRQGIVAPLLDNNGYPRLSGSGKLLGNDSGLTNGTSESLAYLFDPTVKHQGKQSFADTTGLLQYIDGYYIYDAVKNFAEFNEQSNSFTLYNYSGACNTGENGQFFPFDHPEDLANLAKEYPDKDGCQSGSLNHFFGMSLTSSFTQRYGGHVSSGGDPTVFEFSGDDDVWVFIDGVLVADLGGVHQPASVKIDFSDGSVNIKRVYESGTVSPYYGAADATSTIAYNTAAEKTTLRSHFEAAQGNAFDPDQWNGNTFADGTEHTFSFFYLERGSGQSNLKIKYNFKELPEYSLRKTDQYGEAVKGSAFAGYRGKFDEQTKEHLYWANGKYQKIPDNAKVAVDTANNLIVNGEQWATPLFFGETDSEGVMYFLNERGDYYEVDEFLQKNGGDKSFIMREIRVPEGYRTVSDDFVLEFAGEVKENPDGTPMYDDLVLVSKDPYGTGVWASLSGTVISGRTLYPVEDMHGVNAAMTYPEIEYYDTATKDYKGTLFAVVQHRHLDKAWDSLSDTNGWYALYGSDDEGYHEMEEGGKQQSIEAARKQAKYGYNVFSTNGNESKATLHNLPGDPEQYYTFVEQQYFDGKSDKIEELLGMCPASRTGDGAIDQTGRFANCQAAKNADYTAEQLEALDKVRFVVTYYWTPGSLEAADVNNTVRVHSHSGLNPALSTGFDIVWGSEVLVPNVMNTLYYQNFIYEYDPKDTDGQDDNRPWPNVYFALYAVGEGVGVKSAEDTSTLYYIPTGGDALPEGAAGIYLHPDPKRDGVLADIAYYVKEDGSPLYPDDEPGKYIIDQGNPDPGVEDPERGVIKVEIGDKKFTIAPAENAGGTRCIGKTTGVDDAKNYFSRLKEGRYVLRMITPSQNVPYRLENNTEVRYDENSAEEITYSLNITEVPVIVTADANIYANAGSNRDHVTVGNGAGYLVKTLNQFASQGVIDETLTWIALFLRTNYARNFTYFDEFLSGVDNQWSQSALFGTASHVDSEGRIDDDQDGYIKPNNMEYAISRYQTEDLSQAMTTYLQYDPDASKQNDLEDGRRVAFFDYKATEDAEVDGQTYEGQKARGAYKQTNDDDPSLGEGEGKLRLYTDEGWSTVNVYQDNTFGNLVRNQHAGYTSLLEREITPLYSNSTFVAFYSSPSTIPQIKKVAAETEFVAKNWTQASLDATGRPECTGINNSREEEGVWYCRSDYSTEIRNAQFTVKRNTDGLYRTATGWGNKENAKIYTSNVEGVLEEALAWAAGAIYATDSGTAPRYTIEEVSAPAGYSVTNPQITFWLYNKDMDPAETYIAVEPGTPGVTVSESGQTLYIENEPSLSIVKVATGTDTYMYVQVPENETGANRPSLAEVYADQELPEDQRKYTVVPESNGAQPNVEKYFTGYTKPVNDATFILSRTESGNTEYYSQTTEDGRVQVKWTESPTDGGTFTSKEFGVIVSPRLGAGDYVLKEIGSPEAYRLVNPDSDGIRFRVAGNGGSLTFEADADGTNISDDGTILYVENAPIPSIVKVEQGTAKYVSVLLDDQYVGSVNCTDIAADGMEKYTSFGTTDVSGLTDTQIEEFKASGKLLENCFVGYSNNLQGAKFQLEKTSNGVTTHYSGTAEDGTPIWGDSAADLVSASSGLVIALKDGTAGDQYKLTEIAAPNGYALVATSPIEFSLNAESLIEITGQEGLRLSLDGTTLYVENKAGYELPASGGKGLLWWLLMVGLLLVGIALGFAYRQRKQLGR